MKPGRIIGPLLAFCSAAEALLGAPSAYHLYFERNAEQTASTARFIARGPQYSVLLASDEAIFQSGGSVLRLTFVGAKADAEAIALEPVDFAVHYLIGAPGSWRTNVAAFGRLQFRDIYPGVDLVYYTDPSGRLEYDLQLRPGAEPAQIRVRFEGVDSLRTDSNGDVVLRSSHGEWRHSKPLSYQVRNGARHKLTGGMVLQGPDELAFDIRGYDHSLPLVIDPTVAFSTYLGGSGHNVPTSIATDAGGNTYVAGWTESADFGGAPDPRVGVRWGTDAYVAKINAAGKLSYIAFVGGSDDDRAYGVAVDSAGAAVVSGGTHSSNFPLVNAAQPRPGGGRDAFIAKLNAWGSGLIFSTYLGGSGVDVSNAVTVDRDGNAYAAGETASANFPASRGFQLQSGGRQDAFLTKLSSTGSVVYSSYLGGAADDRAAGVAVDASGNAYLTGSTYSTNFPVSSAVQARSGGGQDVFAAKIGSTGSTLIYSTYLGGSGGAPSAVETGNAITVDPAGCAYIVGGTGSANFPTVNPFDSGLSGSYDAFILKLSSSGTALVYSTYLGGSSLDTATAVAVDSAGRAHVAGYTASTDFPTVNAMQNAHGGEYDTFVAILNAGGNTLELSTYFGGMGSDAAAGIAFDAGGGVVITGPTTSANFPLANPIQSFSPAALTASVFRISGVPAAKFVKFDASTKGTWKGAYGEDGSAVAGDSLRYPSYARVNIAGDFSGAWTASTSDIRALQKSAAWDRIAPFWGAWQTLSVDVNLIDGQAHQIALYCLDWDSFARVEKIDVINAETRALLDSRTVSGFNGGQYVVWNITGHVTFRISRLGGANVVVGGIFFGGAPSNTATFVKNDSTTRGGWKNVYGLDGFAIPGDALQYPSYAQVNIASQFSGAWTSSTSDIRAMQKSAASDRIAPFWGAWSSFAIDVNVTDGKSHQFALYCLDWDSFARVEKIDVINTETGALLDSRTVSGFNGGQYVVWNITGHVTFRLTPTGGTNAVISGLFFR